MSSEHIGLRNPWTTHYGDESGRCETTTTVASGATVKGDYVSVHTVGGSSPPGGGDGSDSDALHFKRPKFIRRSYLSHLGGGMGGPCSPVRFAFVATSLALFALGAFTAGRVVTHSRGVSLDWLPVHGPHRLSSLAPCFD